MTIWQSKISAFKFVTLFIPIVFLSGCGTPEERAKSYYESGMALLAKNDDVGARKELNKALKYRTDKVEIWRALAGVDERAKSNALVADLRMIVELDPSDLQARMKLARMMIGGGAAEAALKIIDAANENEKPSAELHALRSIIFLRAKDTAAAVREAQRAFEIDPGHVDAVSILASKKFSDGDADGALKMLETLKLDPKDETRIALQKMQIFAKKGDSVNVEAQLRLLISLNPAEMTYRTQLIQVLIAERRHDEAEKELRARSQANPSDSKAALELVGFLNAIKGVDAARAELEARIKGSADNFDYQIALAELNFGQNKMNEAAQLLLALAKSAATSERKIAAQAKLAEMYVAKANVVAAEPLIAEILAKDRRNASALKLRAALNIEKGQLDSAVSNLREALNDQAKSPELLVLLATAYERGGKVELADRQYADAVKSSNFNPEIALRYVAFLQRRGETSRAEDILVDVSNRNPGNLQVLTSLAQVRLSLKNWNGAVAIADAIERSGSNRAMADQIRASALAGQNKIEESIAALERAHQFSPDAFQPVVALASAYLKSGKGERAVSLLQGISTKYPKNAQVLVLLGQAHLALNNEAVALQNFKEAIVQQPKDMVGYTALSDLYIRQKKFDAVGDVYQAALKEQPDNGSIRLAAASLQILKGDQEAAISEFDAILKDQPNSLVVINNLASLLLDNRSDKPSIDRAAVLAEALKESNVPQFLDTLGWAKYKQGDFQSAIATLEIAAGKLPNLAAIHYHLGMSYAGAGQRDKAEAAFKTALTLEPDGTPLKENIRAAMK